MPQFFPTYISVPKEIKENPEKFGLQQDYWPPEKPSLAEVESCNQIASQISRVPTSVMLDDEQFERYNKAVKIIKTFKNKHQKLPA